ncbi:hypothetical protein B0H13DRAFT_1884616 [Mycena leptocephala]|nr:hypothetical protein B0H13DRAFT_1884616 [Mycena leptocephala]
MGPSSMTKIEALGECIHYRKIIPGSGHTILASSLGGISVGGGYETLWALPPNLNAIDVWHDTSIRSFLYKPTGVQRVAAESLALLYGAPAVGHFIPCFTLRSVRVFSSFPCLLMYGIVSFGPFKTLPDNRQIGDGGLVSTTPWQDRCKGSQYSSTTMLRMLGRHSAQRRGCLSPRLKLSSSVRAGKIHPKQDII